MVYRTVLLAVLLGACDPQAEKEKVESKVASMREKLELDIARTRAFYVQAAAEDGQPGATDCGRECPAAPLSRLVAVQDDGSLIEVQVTTPGLTGEVVAIGVIDTPAYLFFAYEGVKYNDKECNTIPVRKSDGAMFCLETRLGCGNRGTEFICDYNSFQSTEDGGVIYMKVLWSLYRLELNGINDSKQLEITSPNAGGSVGDIVINRNGDLLTTIYKGDNNQLQDVRYYKEAGGFVDLASAQAGYPVVLAGPGSGDDFYWTHGDIDGLTNANNHGSLVKVYPGADDVTSATAAVDMNNNFGFYVGSGKPIIAETATATFMVSINQTINTSSSLTEILNTSGIPRRVEFPDFGNITVLSGCQDHLVLAGTDKDGKDIVERYFPDVPTTTTLPITKEYSISKWAVDSKCRITFSGRRSSDNARIVGQVEPGSETVTVIAAELDADIRQILAIH